MTIFPKVTRIGWMLEPSCTVLPAEKDDRLQLTADWSFVVNDVTVKPRKGFRFEGSVPRIFWRIITPTDPAAWAAFCIHDTAYLLVKRGLCTREQADRMLYLALRRNGFSWIVAHGIYLSVRVFGGAYAELPLTPREEQELHDAGF